VSFPDPRATAGAVPLPPPLPLVPPLPPPTAGAALPRRPVESFPPPPLVTNLQPPSVWAWGPVDPPARPTFVAWSDVIGTPSADHFVGTASTAQPGTISPRPPYEPPKSSRRPAYFVGAAVSVCVLLIALSVRVVTSADSGTKTASGNSQIADRSSPAVANTPRHSGPATTIASKPEIPVPSKWDPKYSDMVAFVEKLEGQPFDYPVNVKLVDDETFEAKVPGPALSPDQKTIDATTEALLRARGYVAADFLLAPYTDRGLILGKYDRDRSKGAYLHESNEVLIRRERLDAFTKSIIVHQLVHAWQGQHYGWPILANGGRNDTERMLLATMVEGDAQSVENRFIRSMSAVEQAAVPVAEDLASQHYFVPPGPLSALLIASKSLGAGLASNLRPTGALSKEFLETAKNQRVWFNQRFVLLPQLPTSTVEPIAPTLDAGDTVLRQNEYQPGFMQDGSLALVLTLASRIDILEAWRVSTTSRIGVSSIAFRRNGIVCVRSLIQGITIDEAKPLEHALSLWIDNGPVGAATLSPAVDGYALTSCDPGSEAPAPAEDVRDTIFKFFAANINAVAVMAQRGDISDDRMNCAGEVFRATFDARVVTIVDLMKTGLDGAPEPGPIVEAREACLAAC
jgi:hypothetical protein